MTKKLDYEEQRRASYIAMLKARNELKYKAEELEAKGTDIDIPEDETAEEAESVEVSTEVEDIDIPEDETAEEEPKPKGYKKGKKK